MKLKFLFTIAFISIFVKAYCQVQTDASKIVDSLYNLGDRQLLTDRNLELLGRLVSSKDRAFKLYYPDGSKVDSALGKEHDTKRSSGFVVTRVIGDEEIWADIDVKGEVFKRKFNVYGASLTTFQSVNRIREFAPDWQKLELKIKKKYGSYFASRAVLVAQIDFYRLSKDFDKLTRAYISYIRHFPKYTDVLVNETAWSDIFPNCNNTKLLSKTANAFRPLLSAFEKKFGFFPTGFYDTYANLLYKSGRIEKAIEWEQRVVLSEKNDGIKKEFVRNLEKMKKGLPTWK